MAITVDKADLGGAINLDGSASTAAFTTTQAVAAGATIVIAVGNFGGASGLLSSVSGGGLSWTVAKTANPVSSRSAGIAYALAPAGLAAGTTITATLVGASVARVIGGMSLLGVKTTSPVDGTPLQFDSGGAAAWSSGSYAIAAGSAIVAISYIDNITAGANTPTSPSLESWDVVDATDDYGAVMEYRIEAGAGSFAVAGTWGSANSSSGVAVAFLAAADGLTDSAPEITVGNSTESIRTATTDPYTFTHTPVGTPKGIVLTAVHGTSATDHISSVTYGGVAMSRVVRATDTATEPGAAEIWFLGSGIPAGAQTVSIDLTSATGDDFQFVCITLLTNDGGDTEVVDSDGVSENVADPSVTLQYNGRQSVAIGAFYGGGASPADFTPNANCSTVDDHDLGVFYAEVIKQTTPGISDFAIGGTAVSDDVAFVAAAFANAHRFRAPATNLQDPG